MLLIIQISKLISQPVIVFRFGSFYNTGNKFCDKLFLNFKRSSSSLRFLVDKHVYLKLCRKIVQAQKSCRDAEVLPVQLAFLPLGTIKHHMENYFVANVLPPWWNLMEINLCKVPGKTLISTAYDLQKINFVSRGMVCKYLQWPDIQKIALYSLNDLSDFNAKHSSMLLHTLVCFLKTYPNESLSADLQSSLSQMFFSLFSSKYFLSIRFGDILFYSSILGFIKSPDLLEKVIPVCLKFFESQQAMKNQRWLLNCHKAGSAFLEWDYNPGQKFCSSLFKTIQDRYEGIKRNERLCAKILKNCLEIALKFNENEFKNFRIFWICEMTKILHRLKKYEIEEILVICLKKYNGNLREIENILTKDILRSFLLRTNCFIISGEQLSYSGLFENTTMRRKMNEENFFNICNQIITEKGDYSISPLDLSYLPIAALKFQNENEFADKVFIKWWLNFEPKLYEIFGYTLVHPIYALVKINKHSNGALFNHFRHLKEHPVFQMARFALKNINNKNFTAASFATLLESVDYFTSQTFCSHSLLPLTEEVSTAFKIFFDPNLFHRRIFIHQYPKSVGNILFFSNKLSVGKPSDDLSGVIVACLSKNFDNQFKEFDSVYVRDHLWNLQYATDTFVAWNLDADKYYKNFFGLFFNEIKINYSKLGQSNFDIMLKYFLLRNILLIVLNFDKEQEFEQIKRLWKSETKFFHKQINNVDINKICALAKERGKSGLLEGILSTSVVDELKRRVQTKYIVETVNNVVDSLKSKTKF